MDIVLKRFDLSNNKLKRFLSRNLFFYFMYFIVTLGSQLKPQLRSDKVDFGRLKLLHIPNIFCDISDFQVH